MSELVNYDFVNSCLWWFGFQIYVQHTNTYMYNVCCNSDKLMIYSQEQQYED